MIARNQLVNLYVKRMYSAQRIAKLICCSTSKVNYWLRIHKIKKRSIGESLYVSHNANGDPFNARSKLPLNFLTGLAMGLFWGEGNKRSKHSVRIGNADPKLIVAFRKFLIDICKVDVGKIKYSLQIFSDVDTLVAKAYWIKQLKIKIFTQRL